MARKPTYEELVQRVKELEKAALKHKRTKETLEASGKKYSALVDNSPDIIYILDPEGHFNFVGGGFEILLGFKAEVLIGKHFTSIIWPEDVKKAEWRFNERRTGERSTKGFEVRLITKEGKGKHFDIKYLPIELYALGVYDKHVSAKDKKFLGTYGVARDITNRKRAEEALMESEQRYRQLFEGISDAVMVYSSQGRFLDCNKVTLQRLGYSHEELLRLSAADIVHPDFHLVMRDNQKRIWAGEITVVESAHRCKDRKVIPVEVNARRIEYKGESAILTVVRDITARKRAEEDRERLFKAIEIAKEAVHIQSPDLITVYANDATANLFGYEKGELIGKHVSLLNADATSEATMRQIVEGIEKDGYWEGEVHNKRKDGSEFLTYAAITAVKDRGGKIINFISTQHDITKRKQAQEQIQASLKEKEILLREIHHRVKNNLQIISSLLDMRIMRTDNQQVIDLFEDTRSKIHTMALIHTQLYQSERFDQINMGNHIQELVNYLSQIYVNSNVSITPIIECSDVHLSITQAVPCALVLNELVSNAFNHAFKGRKKGTIEISLKMKDHNKVFLKVKDNGIGIPEEIDILKTNSLGLKLMRNTVQSQLMGDIHIEQGVGTTIIVEFNILEQEGNHA